MRLSGFRGRVWPAAPVVAALLLALAPSRDATGVLLPGGGSKRSDCYSLLDVDSPFPGEQGRQVTCVDGDPSCDHDGLCDGTCRFAVRVCINDDGVGQCRPPATLRSLRVRGDLLPAPASLTGPGCGDFADVVVAVKGPLLRQKVGRRVIVVTARGRGTDRDRFVLACAPRLGDCPPPPTTTTTSPPTTTTVRTTTTTPSIPPSTSPSTSSTSTSTSTSSTSTTAPTSTSSTSTTVSSTSTTTTSTTTTSTTTSTTTTTTTTSTTTST